MEAKTQRRVLSLRAENVKRVRAVFIEFDGNVTILSGKNDEGKSSTIDALDLALGGKSASKKVIDALRHGENYGASEVDLGDIIAKRVWTRDEDGSVTSKIELRSKDGAVYKSPQGILDSFTSAIASDPLAFRDMKGPEQTAALMHAIGKADELTEIDARREGIFQTRADVNRRVRDLQGQLNGMPEIEGVKDGDEEKSVAEIAARMEEARRVNEDNNEVRKLLTEADNREALLVSALGELELQLEKARDIRTDASREADLARIHVNALEPDVDLVPMSEELAGVDDHNKRVREYYAREKAALAVEEKTTESKRLTDDIDAVDAEKAKILATADLPLPQLGIGEHGVTYDGVSLKDCSESKQTRISVAMAMALNPGLRMIMIRNGAALDSDAVKMISDMADENDFHVIIERIEDDTPGAVIIEDGMVKGASDEA